MFAAVLAVVLTLFLVIGVHELGHALVARWFGVGIKRISIGFGRPILQWSKGENSIRWVWGIWPLGGFVALLNSRLEPVHPSLYPNCFDKKSMRVRVLILSAGIAANLVLAWFAFVLVFSLGLAYKPALIESVRPDSLAAKAGLQAEDRILAVEGKPTLSWEAVGMQWISSWGQKSVQVKVQGRGEKRQIILNLSDLALKEKRGSLLEALGIVPFNNAPKEVQKAASFGQALSLTNHQIAEQVLFYLTLMKQIILGRIPFSQLLGPLGLFASSVAFFKEGLSVFLYFIASLSLAVAAFNLLPIPGLDGGSLVYCVIEKVRGKPLSLALEQLIYRLMYILLCVVLIQLLINDVLRFV
jgi:regulator of sigma E protease